MTRLSTLDAFFVAYQAQSGVLMHFGAEIELTGVVERGKVDAAIAHALQRWPQLGQTLARDLWGLKWTGVPRSVLHETADPEIVPRWRNTPIDPFREPPFGVLLVRGGTSSTLAFRCHHAIADGQLFFAICSEILRAIAAPLAMPRDARTRKTHPLAFTRLVRRAKLGELWRHASGLSREARADRSARIAVAANGPGDIAICVRHLDPGALVARATEAAVRAPWLVAAAWLRTLHAWNVEHGDHTPVFSVEVPVALRRGVHGMARTGNQLSVLTLFADPRVRQSELARGLWRDYATGVRRGAHLAMPLLSAPLRVLPWSVFRRVAMTSTGFATTHFTWLAHDPDTRAEVTNRSAGALAMANHNIYTPVCLRMGAALSVVAWRDELRLTITHRLCGLSAAEASVLGDMLVARLVHADA